MPISPVYRTREITRDTCIRGFTGRQIVKSGVFDASTLQLQTFTNPAQYVNIYGSNLQTLQGFYVPIGTLLTPSSNDPTKVMAFTGPVVGGNDVQTVSITGGPASGGSFTLSFNGATSAAIPYNSAAEDVEDILEVMSTIGYSNVAVSGGPLPGTPVVVTFEGLLGNSLQPVMTIGANNLTGGSAPTPSVAHTTSGSAGQQIIGVYDGTPWRDFFYNVVLADEAVPIFFHSVAFDVSKIQNWELYGDLAIAALPTCSFY